MRNSNKNHITITLKKSELSFFLNPRKEIQALVKQHIKEEMAIKEWGGQENIENAIKIAHTPWVSKN